MISSVVGGVGSGITKFIFLVPTVRINKPSWEQEKNKIIIAMNNPYKNYITKVFI